MKTCDICGVHVRPTKIPVYQTYKGMPFNCCKDCIRHEDMLKFKMEPIWLKWRDNMCTYAPKTPVTTKPEFQAQTGEVWYMRGRKLVIDKPELRYFNTNGDVDTKYLSFQFEDDGSWNISTHKMFAEEAKREEPLVERYITPRQILNNGPCEEGIVALGTVLGVVKKKLPQPPAWKVVQLLSERGFMGNHYDVAELARRHEAQIGPVNLSYLRFIAKTLNLIPTQLGIGPGEVTLARLLGIK